MPLRYVPRSIASTECIGNTLSTINISFSALDTATHLLSTHVDFLSATMISVSSTLQSRIMYLSTTMIEVSSSLQTQINFLSSAIQSVSGNLHTEINFVSANVQSTSAFIQSEINFLSANILTPRIAHVSNDHVLVSTGLSAVSGLYFSVAANKQYHYDFTIDYVNSINTEGLIISLSGTAAYSSLRFYGVIYHADNGAVLAQGVRNTYGQLLSANTGSPSISGTAYLKGCIHTTGAGQVMLMAATETGGSNTTTINAGGFGSIVVVQESH